ncbi:hypothetical protein JTB14_022006 [Gonioctena quinquepunctata]|nr:hypothetical protein JTB14_022006 [Gonioctena quinquepunctata]
MSLQQQCNTKHKNYSIRKVRLMHLNVRSLKCKVPETEVLLADQRPDIFCATEHWCNEEGNDPGIADHLAQIINYTDIETNVRDMDVLYYARQFASAVHACKSKRGGDSAIYLKEGLRYKNISTKISDTLTYLAVEVKDVNKASPYGNDLYFFSRPGFSFAEIIYNHDIDGDIFVEPPAPNVDTGGDSGDEDDGGLLDNLTSRQLRANAEIRLINNERIGINYNDDDTESSIADVATTVIRLSEIKNWKTQR